jgi:hypothetical protein
MRPGWGFLHPLRAYESGFGVTDGLER